MQEIFSTSSGSGNSSKFGSKALNTVNGKISKSVVRRKGSSEIMQNRSILLSGKTSTQRSKPLLLMKKTISVGAFCELKVTALGPNNVGIDEFTYGFSILIPKAKLGETVKAQIKRIFNFKKAKYAVARRYEVVSDPNDGRKGVPVLKMTENIKQNLSVGDILTVKLEHVAIQTDSSPYLQSKSVGLAKVVYSAGLSSRIIIPLNPQMNGETAKVGQEIKIKVTKIKLKYAFAIALSGLDLPPILKKGMKSFPSYYGDQQGSSSLDLSAQLKQLKEKSKLNLTSSDSPNDRQLVKGSKITLTLPKTAKKYAKHIVILLKERPLSSSRQPSGFSSHLPMIDENHKELSNSSIDSKKTSKYVLFLKNLVGAKFGDKVRVKFSKIGSTFAIGKVIRIAPNSPLKKLARARKNLNEMLTNGMHYGEKVVKCQAKMRSYIWNRKRSQNMLLEKKPGSSSAVRSAGSYPKPPLATGSSELKNGVLNTKVRSAVPFGVKGGLLSSDQKDNQRDGGVLRKVELSQKGEKNSPLIKKGRHLINLLKTRRCLNIGLNQLTKYAAKGRTFLFVGTKKPAAGLIARAALFSKTSFFVNTRWLGGMLTNWKTIIKSISKIRPILKEKQKVISNILQKRAIIQNRLIKKVVSLRKKSKVLIKKGKQLIDAEKVKNLALLRGSALLGESGQNKKNSDNHASSSSEKSGLLIKRKSLFERGQFLLQKRQSLLNKQNLLKEKTLEIKESGFLIANKYKILLNRLTATHKKLHDIRLMFILNKELRNITKLAKEQGKNQYTLSYGKFKQFASLAGDDATSSDSGSNSESSPLYKERGLVKMSSKKLWLIPNPPQEILNKILITISSLAANNLNSKKRKSSYSDSDSDSNSSGLMNFSVKEKNNNSLPITNLKKAASLPEGILSGSKDPSSSSSEDVKKSIVLTKLLSKFSRFLPYIKNAISSMLRLMLGMVKKMTALKTHLKNLKTKLSAFIQFNKKINGELKLIQRKYTSEQQIIRVLRRKLKRHEAEKKLLQFLPKLRYLPTPKSQIALAIQILMKRFVDPKMKYPMDLIYDEKLRKKSKKVAASRKKKWQRLETYFGGIANMTKLKKTQISNNVAIIIGQQEEMNAVLECKKLGIKMFHIVDTNCNPGLADHFIPSNDDSRNSIKYLLTKIVTRIRLAQKIRLRFKVLYKK